MSTELATVRDDQIDLVKRTVAVGATNDELQLFLSQCNRTGLDPFAKQIYFIKRGGKGTIQVSIDGLRLIAERTGRYAGQDGPWWCGDDGVWRDVWLTKNPPAAAKVVVKKALPSGVIAETSAVARFDSYNANQGLWKSMPEVMIAKCAESLALRKAFPQETSGVYVDAEMDQAGADPEPAHITRHDFQQARAQLPAGDPFPAEQTVRRKPPAAVPEGMVSAADGKWDLVGAYMRTGSTEEDAKKSASAIWAANNWRSEPRTRQEVDDLVAWVVEQGPRPVADVVTGEIVDEPTFDIDGAA